MDLLAQVYSFFLLNSPVIFFEIYCLKNTLKYFSQKVWLNPISFDGKSLKDLAGSGWAPNGSLKEHQV